MPDHSVIEELKKLAKDDASFKRLTELFEQVYALKQQKEQHLNLLEAAIRNDYDSILITELNLEKPGPRIVYVNDGFLKMTGYTREEVIGQTPRILQGPKTDRKVLDKLKKSLQEGGSFFGQTINYRKDGSEFVNQWDIHPLLDRDGNITHWVSYQHDITERKRAERRLIDSNLDMNDSYEETKKICLDLSPEGAVVGSNVAFREMLGYDKDEITNYHLWELTPEKHADTLKNIFSSGAWKKEFADGSTKALILEKKNGMATQVEAKTRILELKDGGQMIRCDITNVSLRKNVMKVLKQRNQEFNKIFERKADFKYGLEICESGEPSFTWFSEGFSNMTGYKPEEMTGSGGWKKLVHKDDHKQATGHLQSVSKGKSSCEKIRIVLKDGTVKTIMDYVKLDENDSKGRMKGSAIEVKKDSLSLV
ncbi:MAG: PAS domain S-box protein [Cyclonatronaceae bacterium]